ncbi:MAG TPA: alpha/beta hydrolase [Clostridia bacterium]|nr:alpha/beta hydrolase [Clostridia bacterium]
MRVVLTNDTDHPHDSRDRWASFERASYFARCWGAELIDVGEACHINAGAGCEPWPQGLEILCGLRDAGYAVTG